LSQKLVANTALKNLKGMAMAKTAFVTGGTGFVGLNLIDELIKQGWTVTALHRPTSDLTYLGRFKVDLVVGEVTDQASLLAAIPVGTDTVFHVAGNTNMWRQGNAEQTRDNVEGTHNVVEAAIAKSVRRLVVTSSISAYGDVSGAVTEDTPSQAAHSWVNYEKTKYQAQEVARAAMARGLEVVVMQPGGIIGPWDIGTWSRMFQMVRDDKLPGVPPASLSFGHVTEVVKAHIVAAERGENGGNYLLAGTDATMLDLVSAIARLIGKPVPTKTISPVLLAIVARVGDFVSTFTKKAPSFTPEMAEGLGGTVTVSSAKAIKQLGYKTVPLEVMVKDCHDWMVAEGRI
jgi:nucleoside-diphosphate-sugar epimerase